MMQKTFTGILIGVLLLTGCSLFSAATEPASTSTATPILNILLQADANATTTLTPFQPMPPTATTGPTDTPTPTNTPTLTATPTIPSSVYLGLSRPEGQVNILLLGSDYREGQGFRTDVMMILSLNPTTEKASLMSFPRDLYVNIPDVGMNRINAAMPEGGFSMIASTLKKNFDVTVDYYILVNFSGFKEIIDTMGGIEVYAAKSLKDKCDLPQAVDKYCTISPGYNSMDGATALWYVRSRNTSSDFDRMRRDQEVMSAIFKKMMSLDAVNNGTALYDVYQSSVETDLSLEKVLELLPFATKILDDPSIVKQYTIGASYVTNYTVPATGAQVLLPDWISITPLIQQAFYQ